MGIAMEEIMWMIKRGYWQGGHGGKEGRGDGGIRKFGRRFRDVGERNDGGLRVEYSWEDE